MDPKEWMAEFSDDLKGNEILNGFEGPEALAKSHLELLDASGKPWTESLSDEMKTKENLEALKGLEKVDDLTKDYLKLKSETVIVPEKPEDYELSPLPEGVKEETDLRKDFRSWALEAKLSNDQAKVLDAKFDEFIIKEIEADKQAQESAKTKAIDALKGEWKTDYEKNKETALTAFAKLVPDEEERKKFGEFGNNPAVIKLFHKIGTMISEDKFVEGKKGTQEPKSAAEVLYPKQK